MPGEKMAARKKKMSKSRGKISSEMNKGSAQVQDLYNRACRLAEEGQFDQARAIYENLRKEDLDDRMKALVSNDLAALAAQEGHVEEALQGFRASVASHPQCEPAIANLDLLQADCKSVDEKEAPGKEPDRVSNAVAPQEIPCKIAILSFLFNWPSTGGGIVHTVELAKFLARAGYEVQHIYACYPAWGVGAVQGPLPFASQALDFDDTNWDVANIRSRFRRAVDAFGPDHVIITDSWNIKPLLAEAVQGYPYILRFQAMECLCPLNNVRFLWEGNGRFRQCHRHQLANPEVCTQCVSERGHQSGSLHQAERALSGVGKPDYHRRLVRAFERAEAVLVVNPLQEAMLSPYCQRVQVVTAGMDPARFPWPCPDETHRATSGKAVLFFAGLVEEVIKGFKVLHDACSLLWNRRQDFELVATGDPPCQVDPFTRYIGWQSQEDLPRHLRACDLLVIPTIAQEALGRTAVEAMATGRPVIASRLGGLPFTVADGSTGLLCEPGDSTDLASKIEILLNDSDLRRRLGLAGRQRFEKEYSWDVIIERYYRPLLSRSAKEGSPVPLSPDVPLLAEGREGNGPYPSPSSRELSGEAAHSTEEVSP
jgi:glycosyltransferase involved in cell wall biosynthesis